jgi:hypothetical protein
VPNGPANAGGLNNSGNDPSGAGNSAKVPTAPGTNSAGTANSSGPASGPTVGGSTNAANGGAATTSATVGANNRVGNPGGRIDGVTNPQAPIPGDAAINAENAKVDAKVKSIRKGC